MGEQLKPELFELNNGSIRIKITNYGANVTHLFVPDKRGLSTFFFFNPFFLFISIYIHTNLYFISADFDVDYEGNVADIVLGFDSIESYVVS